MASSLRVVRSLVFAVACSCWQVVLFVAVCCDAVYFVVGVVGCGCALLMFVVCCVILVVW